MNAINLSLKCRVLHIMYTHTHEIYTNRLDSILEELVIGKRFFQKHGVLIVDIHQVLYVCGSVPPGSVRPWFLCHDAPPRLPQVGTHALHDACQTTFHPGKEFVHAGQVCCIGEKKRTNQITYANRLMHACRVLSRIY